MINKLLRISFLLIFLFSFSFSKAQISDYEIKVKFKNLENTVCYLGFHFGNNKYIRDTAIVNNKGIVVFKGKKPIEGGIYLIITPSKNYFEFILNEKNIYMEADTAEFIDNMNVITSEENKAFYSYLKYMKKEHFERANYEEQLALHKGNKDSSAFINKEIALVDTNVKKYRENLIRNNPNLFFVKVLKTMDEPRVREKGHAESDSVYGKFVYNWYQIHYFDNVDFSDSRLLRTPIFEAKIDKYMEDLTLKHPDSIKYAAERVIDKSRINEDIFKFTLIKLFNKYAQSKYMGQDAIFLYLAEKYYLSGLAYWTDSNTLNKIYDRVVKIRSNLIGNAAPNLIMKDTSGFFKSMYDLKTVYTILIFWDPDCSHCRAEIPVLVDWYKVHSKDSFSIYAVGVTTDRSKWTKFIREHNMNFINVWDPGNATNFRVYYDVYSTPVIYVIDKKKTIQAKKIGVEQIDEIIGVLNKEKSK